MFTSCGPLKSCCCCYRNRRVQFICNHVLNSSLALQTITLTRVHLSVQRSWIKLRLFGTVGGTNLSMFLARHLLPSLSIGSLPSAMFSGAGQGRSRQSAHWDTSRPRLTWESQHRHTWSCMLVAPHEFSLSTFNILTTFSQIQDCVKLLNKSVFIKNVIILKPHNTFRSILTQKGYIFLYGNQTLEMCQDYENTD